MTVDFWLSKHSKHGSCLRTPGKCYVLLLNLSPSRLVRGTATFHQSRLDLSRRDRYELTLFDIRTREWAQQLVALPIKRATPIRSQGKSVLSTAMTKARKLL